MRPQEERPVPHRELGQAVVPCLLDRLWVEPWVRRRVAGQDHLQRVNGLSRGDLLLDKAVRVEAQALDPPHVQHHRALLYIEPLLEHVRGHDACFAFPAVGLSPAVLLLSAVPHRASLVGDGHDARLLEEGPVDKACLAIETPRSSSSSLPPVRQRKPKDEALLLARLPENVDNPSEVGLGVEGLQGRETRGAPCCVGGGALHELRDKSILIFFKRRRRRLFHAFAVALHDRGDTVRQRRLRVVPFRRSLAVREDEHGAQCVLRPLLLGQPLHEGVRLEEPLLVDEVDQDDGLPVRALPFVVDLELGGVEVDDRAGRVVEQPVVGLWQVLVARAREDSEQLLEG
mmetsp:Transcript_23199/g.55514  ORF Transcript_23199/g.55514 Transcript_23199/m.55514 type:complete len:344 (-) Transcript_23199:1831-2862(-)